MPQAATTGALESAQRIILASARYTEEHNMPAVNLTESFTLPKGAKQVSVPKVGQMSMSDLTDGQDIIDEEEIGMTMVDLTAAAVGAKVILTDKLIRQAADNIFTMVGRQLGDGMARKKDNDVTALYSGFSTELGASGREFDIANVAAAVAYAKGSNFGSQLYINHHPFTVFDLAKEAAGTAATYPMTPGWSQDLLGNFWSGIRPIFGVPFFEDGNITRTTAAATVGVIADKSALAVLKSVDTRTERQRDASLRATELVMTSDYGVFELDDSRGAALTLDSTTPATTS